MSDQSASLFDDASVEGNLEAHRAAESLVESQLEIFDELLAAHKELIELTSELADKFAFLSQASRLMDQALQLA